MTYIMWVLKFFQLQLITNVYKWSDRWPNEINLETNKIAMFYFSQVAFCWYSKGSSPNFASNIKWI